MRNRGVQQGYSSGSPLLACAIAQLIEESPSVKAAMKAGKQTSLRIRVHREATGRWEDYGVVVQNGAEGWGSWLKGKLGVMQLIYRVNGEAVDKVEL